MALFKGHRRHGGQTHVEVWLVEYLMFDVVGTEFLDDAEKRRLVGHTNGDARWGYVKVLWLGETTGDLKGRMVRLNHLLREADVLPHEHIEVGVLLENLVLGHVL